MRASAAELQQRAGADPAININADTVGSARETALYGRWDRRQRQLLIPLTPGSNRRRRSVRLLALAALAAASSEKPGALGVHSGKRAVHAESV